MKIVSKQVKPENLLEEFDIECLSIEEFASFTEVKASAIGVQFVKPVTGKVYLTYPLDVIVEADIVNSRSVGQILWQIAKTYDFIYKDEDETCETEVVPVDERGSLLNRNSTDGKYGIWGHDLGDLVFEKLAIYDNNVIEIWIGS